MIGLIKVIDESVVKLFEESLDLRNAANTEEQLNFWQSMKKYLTHGRKEDIINGRSLNYLTNNLTEIIKFLRSINCNNHEIILILTKEPSLLNIIKDLYNKYLFLGIIENPENDFRKRKLLTKTIEFRVSLKKVFQRYCFIKDVKYPSISWNILMHASDKEFADIFIFRAYKKPYQLFETEEDVYYQLNKYSLEDLNIDDYKDLDVNREIVEQYEGKKRR